MRPEELKLGAKVRVKRPESTADWPRWTVHMDALDGSIGTVVMLGHAYHDDNDRPPETYLVVKEDPMSSKLNAKWVEVVASGERCPVCGSDQSVGHAPSCPKRAAA